MIIPELDVERVCTTLDLEGSGAGKSVLLDVMQPASADICTSGGMRAYYRKKSSERLPSKN